MFDDEDYPDYFIDDTPEQPSQPTSAPQPDPRVIRFDAPQPAAQPQPQVIVTKPKPGCTIGATMVTILFAALVIGALVGYFRYLSPCVEHAETTATIVSIETRGTLFKTIEAEVMSDRELDCIHDPKASPQQVTIATDELAERLKRYQLSGQPITLVYKRYHATLPWRGESTTVVTDLRE